jgi:hypothetical protein
MYEEYQQDHVDDGQRSEFVPDDVSFMKRTISILKKQLFEANQQNQTCERKRKSALKAYFTLIHDTRTQASDLRRWIDDKKKDDEDGELEDTVTEIIETIQEKTLKMISLGHCPLSGEPLGASTYINVCGHIFDKASLLTSKISMCPLCSHKIVLPRT